MMYVKSSDDLIIESIKLSYNLALAVAFDFECLTLSPKKNSQNKHEHRRHRKPLLGLY